jgi:subtilisin family serine protease
MAHRQRRPLRPALLVVLSLLVLPGTALGADPPLAEPAPKSGGPLFSGGLVAKVSPRLATASGTVAAFVQLTTPSAGTAFTSALPKGRVAARQAATVARRQSDGTATAVVRELRGRDKAATELYRISNAVAGVAVIADADSLRALAARPDVERIATIVPKRIINSNAAVLTRVLTTWQDLGLFGDGMRVGVIDTGIDYTHANFGGPGTTAAFDSIDPTAGTALFPSAKVIGGIDFAGEEYDAGSTDPAEFTPHPDGNPLDCDAHGSHVAGTAAGFGEDGAGSTFTGDYSSLTTDDLKGMRIGPGMSPKALLYAIKVFGCPTGAAGSTFLVAAGLDWTLDPNGDGDFSDHLDVVNISVGADYTTPDDPDSDVARRIIGFGVMPVFSAGNGGDLYDIGSNAPEVLSVASSRDSYDLLDAMEVTAPAGVVGNKPGQYSVAFDYDGFDRTAPVVALTDATNLDGCAPFSAADAAAAAGKIAWLEWDDDDATRRCGSASRTNNATSAGAVGVVLTSTLAHFAAGIAGNAAIPVFQMTGPVTAELRPARIAGTLIVRFAGVLRTSFKLFDPTISDTPSSFTSRGTRSPGVKPDVSAPGHTIASTRFTSGNGVMVISGTSMASPHVAGIATLVRQAHPSWTPNEVKAAVMDTANHEIFSQDGPSGPIEAPNRVGSGRVDARAALGTNVLAFDQHAPGIVSVGFGVVEVSDQLTRDRYIKLVNKGSTPVTFKVAYEPATRIRGVSFLLNRSSVSLRAFGTATVRVRLSIRNPAAMRKTADPTVEKLQLDLPRQFLADASGRVVFTPTRGTDVALRVSVYAAPKPTASISVPKQLQIPNRGSRRLVLGGTGLNQGSGDARYLSLYSVLELQATSPKLRDCGRTVISDCAINATARGGDLRYIGAGSTAPAAKAAGVPGNSLLGFGIATWANWANIGSNTIPFVDIDVDGDKTPDFETFVAKFTDTDVLVAATVDLASGNIVDIQAVNELLGDVDANVFDTNVIVLPVLVEALGINPVATSARLTYQVGVAGYYTAPGSSLIDLTPTALSFDPLKPGLWAEGAGDPSLVFAARPGTTVRIHKDSSALRQDKANSLLVLNFHNRTGQRAAVVQIKSPPRSDRSATGS